MIHSTSLVTGKCHLLTTTGIFASQLLSSTLQLFSNKTLLFCEVYHPETVCKSISLFNKPNSYSFVLIFCCGHEFQFLGVPENSRRPSRSTFPTFLDSLKKSVEPYSVQGSNFDLNAKRPKRGWELYFLVPTAHEPQLLGRPARPGHYTDWAMPALWAVYTCLTHNISHRFNTLWKRFLTEDGEVLALIVQVVEADIDPHALQLGSHGGKYRLQDFGFFLGVDDR